MCFCNSVQRAGEFEGFIGAIEPIWVCVLRCNWNWVRVFPVGRGWHLECGALSKRLQVIVGLIFLGSSILSAANTRGNLVREHEFHDRNREAAGGHPSAHRRRRRARAGDARLRYR